MAIETLMYRVDGYLYSSPRYHAITNLSTTLLPDNYANYDDTNRSYDKYFPCYALNLSDKPQLQLVNADGQPTALKGDAALFLAREKGSGRKIGRKEKPDSPANSGLEEKTVFYSEFTQTRLTPGWSELQVAATTTDGQSTYSPYLLIRCLGNSDSVRQNLTVDLDEYKVTLLASPFPVGFLARYQGRIWRCVNRTDKFPNIEDSDWEELLLEQNVFNVDLYGLTADNSAYMTQISAPDRQFNPRLEDETLVSWNVSYYHT